MPTAISAEAIEKGTDQSWTLWRDYFASIDAANLTHAEIVRKLASQKNISGWWTQMQTVAFEQEIGRRQPGQDCNGEFSVSVSKTLNHTDLDSALTWWLLAVHGRTEFSDIPLSGEPKISKTEKWRYWSASLADGTRVSVHISLKAPGKSNLGIMHEKLESTDQIEHWRSFWKQMLNEASAEQMG